MRLDDVSEPRAGQRVAFVMDTARCDGAELLAEGADLLVCEATFLHRDAALAREHLHLTARQAGRLAREAGVRRLVLLHFSQRYTDLAEFEAEAEASTRTWSWPGTSTWWRCRTGADTQELSPAYKVGREISSVERERHAPGRERWTHDDAAP